MANIVTSTTDYASWHLANRARVTTRIDALKQAVIDPLRLHGIAAVAIHFDGYGDSGAVEEVTCRSVDDREIELPEIAVAGVDDDGQAVQTTLRQALESLAYAALELHHPGWENNDGAGGALEIDVADASFALDCKLRYTAYDDHYTEL